jgi:hypothetical protein
MASYIWMCPRCEKERVSEEDELCEYCREDIEGSIDLPVDTRMKGSYNKRIAEGFDHEY